MIMIVTTVVYLWDSLHSGMKTGSSDLVYEFDLGSIGVYPLDEYQGDRYSFPDFTIKTLQTFAFRCANP